MLSTDLLFSLILHALILFCILTVLFFQVIAVMAKKGINNAVTNNVKNAVTTFMLSTGQLDWQTRLLLKNLPIGKISDYYSVPDEAVEVNNFYIQVVSYIIIALLASMFIVPGLFLFYSAERAISLFRIVVENIAVFAFIGVFEIAFFLLIALKYIPITTDALVLAVIKGLQE